MRLVMLLLYVEIYYATDEFKDILTGEGSTR